MSLVYELFDACRATLKTDDEYVIDIPKHGEPLFSTAFELESSGFLRPSEGVEVMLLTGQDSFKDGSGNRTPFFLSGYRTSEKGTNHRICSI